MQVTVCHFWRLKTAIWQEIQIFIASRTFMYDFQALQWSLAGRTRDAAAGCWRSKVDALRMKLAHGPRAPSQQSQLGGGCACQVRAQFEVLLSRPFDFGRKL